MSQKYRNIKKYKHDYYIKNKKKINKKHRLYYLKNKIKIISRAREWASNNVVKIQQYKRKYKIKNKNRYNKDTQYKLSELLRSRLRAAIKNNQKVGSAIKDLGCSVLELKIYLESKFKPGMSWKNWKFRGWHIDHIIPISKFNLSKRKELLKACHYSNLQPLWWHENISKGNRNEN